MIYGTVCDVTVDSSMAFMKRDLFVLLNPFFISNYFPLCFFFCLLSVMTLPLKPGQLKLGFQLCPKVPHIG